MESFRYAPLVSQPQHIRVIRIKPGEDDESVECELAHQHLNYGHVCLSYTWGEATDSKEILINGRKATVWANLWHFLHTARRYRFTEWIWIDAICINQADDDEKSSQVRQMGEIYYRARFVIVWLGLTDEEAASLARFDGLLRGVPMSSEHRHVQRAWQNMFPSTELWLGLCIEARVRVVLSLLQWYPTSDGMLRYLNDWVSKKFAERQRFTGKEVDELSSDYLGDEGIVPQSPLEHAMEADIVLKYILRPNRFDLYGLCQQRRDLLSRTSHEALGTGDGTNLCTDGNSPDDNWYLPFDGSGCLCPCAKIEQDYPGVCFDADYVETRSKFDLELDRRRSYYDLLEDVTAYGTRIKRMQSLDSLISFYRDNKDMTEAADVVRCFLDMGSALRSVSNSNYWRRAWVVQEVWLAKRAVLLSPVEYVAVGSVLRMLGGVYRSPRESTADQSALEWPIGGLTDFEGWCTRLEAGSEEGIEVDLTYLLCLTENRVCADWHDKVYSIISLSPLGSEIRVDYSASREQVFWDVISCGFRYYPAIKMCADDAEEESDILIEIEILASHAYSMLGLSPCVQAWPDLYHLVRSIHELRPRRVYWVSLLEQDRIKRAIAVLVQRQAGAGPYVLCFELDWWEGADFEPVIQDYYTGTFILRWVQSTESDWMKIGPWDREPSPTSSEKDKKTRSQLQELEDIWNQ